LAEAYVSLAWSELHYDYNFADAERDFERSIEMNFRSATAHHWFGMTLGMMGRYEEGYTELKRAIRLDPHWSLIHFGMAFVYWCGRRYDQAIEECHEALELDSNTPQAHVWLGLSYVAKLTWEPAIAALHKAVEVSRRTPVAVACLGEAYAAAGFADEARNVLRELTGKVHVTAYFVSRIHAALGRATKPSTGWKLPTNSMGSGWCC
jgi:tetratricopeptide (TPR) repeat protein